jgi:hypothetical protein
MHKCTLRILCLKGLRTVCQHSEKCVKKETNSPSHPPDLLLQMKAIYRFTELWRPYFQTFVGFTPQNDALLVHSTVEAVFVLSKPLLTCVHSFGSVFEPKAVYRFIGSGGFLKLVKHVVFENLPAWQREK